MEGEEELERERERESGIKMLNKYPSQRSVN
jgi:hypothetical protein